MRWADDGIFLAGRPHGETSVIAGIFTRDHGRSLGLVKGGRSRRLRPLLQTGNGLKVEWRARLDDQLGVYTVELAEPVAARVLDDKIALSGITALASLLQVLPERDPHPKLFDVARDCLAVAGEPDFPASMIQFELRLLEELGFGLELSHCAATGRSDDLAYVSPRSGQAVTREAGEPYQAKLLRLPEFLIMRRDNVPPSRSDIEDGLALTGFFLKTHVFADRGIALPQAREDFAHLLHRRN